MSYGNYLREGEEISHLLDVGAQGEKAVRRNVLGVTQKRVFHFRSLKGFERTYRDVPLSNILYLENAWYDRNLILLVLGMIFLISGVILLSTFMQFIGLQIISLVLIVIGIIFLVKGLKQYGSFLINNDEWKFHFKRKEDIKKIEEIIQEIYFIKGE